MLGSLQDARVTSQDHLDVNDQTHTLSSKDLFPHTAYYLDYNLDKTCPGYNFYPLSMDGVQDVEDFAKDS